MVKGVERQDLTPQLQVRTPTKSCGVPSTFEPNKKQNLGKSFVLFKLEYTITHYTTRLVPKISIKQKLFMTK